MSNETAMPKCRKLNPEKSAPLCFGLNVFAAVFGMGRFLIL